MSLTATARQYCKAIIEPSVIKGCELPEHCVILFYDSVMKKLMQGGLIEKIYEIMSVLAPNEIYKLKHGNKFLTVTCSTDCGVPLAEGLLEEVWNQRLETDLFSSHQKMFWLSVEAGLTL